MKNFTLKQVNVAYELIKAEYKKEQYLEMVDGEKCKKDVLLKIRIENKIDKENNFICTTLDSFNNKGRFDLLDCVEQLGNEKAKYKDFSNDKPNNKEKRHNDFARYSRAVKDTYYDNKINSLIYDLNEKKINRTKDDSFDEVETLENALSNMDNRDIDAISTRITALIEKSIKGTKKKENYYKYIKTYQDLIGYQSINLALIHLREKNEENKFEV